MKKTLALVAFAALAFVAFQAQSPRQDGLYLGSKTKPVIVQGALNVAGGIDGGGVYTPLLKADVIDAGQLFVQGFGPVTRTIPGTATIDFTSTSITCTDSSGTTTTGSRVGDPCFVGMPATLTAGGTGLNATYSCYVSAADTVKVRHCAAGTADDPASVIYNWVVISTAQ